MVFTKYLYFNVHIMIMESNLIQVLIIIIIIIIIIIAVVVVVTDVTADHSALNEREFIC